MLETLLSETKQILERVEDEIKLWIRVRAAESPYLSVTRLSDYLSGPGNGISLTYKPTTRSVDYAIAHEAVRVMRYFRTPPEERAVLVSTAEHRRAGYTRMEADLASIPTTFRAMSRDMFGLFYDGLLTQILSTPADFWINQWLLENYPGFGTEIANGLAEVFANAHVGLKKEIEAFTPRTVYSASNSMNAAFACFVDELLEGVAFSAPYRITRFEGIGARLRSLNPNDRGHAGDRETTDLWARELELRGWYGWRGRPLV